MKYFLAVLLTSCLGLNAIEVDEKKFLNLLQTELKALSALKSGLNDDEIYEIDYFFLRGQDRGIEFAYKAFQKCIKSEDDLIIDPLDSNFYFPNKLPATNIVCGNLNYN